MRKTVAYNGIILGIFLGLWVGLKTNSGAVTVIAMIGFSVLAFAVIRVIENAIDAGVDKAYDAISEHFNDRNRK